MSRKPKFNPEITRVKLNPEQAVLTCLCFNGMVSGGRAMTTICINPGTKETTTAKSAAGSSAVS